MMKNVYLSISYSLWMLFMSVTAHGLTVVTLESQTKAVLKAVARPVAFPLSQADIDLAAQMKALLYELGGVGIAAPQVNQQLAMLAIYIPEDAALLRDNVVPHPMQMMINPSYEPFNQGEIKHDFEGCYSVTHKMGKVPRYQSIKLTYYDEEGVKHSSIESGFFARVVQHEIDHLNGILIVERLTPDCVQGNHEDMLKLRREELSDEKKILFDKLIAKKTIGGSAMPSTITNINAEKAIELVKSGKAILIDVREQHEYDANHIPDALLVPLSDFDSKKSEIKVSEKLAIFHCRSGGRTENYKEIFAGLGFKEIALLDGGIIAWEEAGGEVKKSQSMSSQ